MLFNSIDFAFFLPLVFCIYWLLKNHLKTQNLFITVASYVFYGWWDWRFLFLIAFSTGVDFVIGKSIKNTYSSKTKKVLLFCSLFTNLSLLGVFKYYNFFVDNFVTAFSLFGQQLEISTLSIILPVGISFYTFQTLSYTIDIYRNKLEPAKDFISFAAFVSFFPQLVAGPIERATHLLPQFYAKRKFDYTASVDGLRQIIWGLFKKMVVADNCAGFVNSIFQNYQDHSGSTLFVGAVLFAVQIYCDFSGYSDIAIGTARLFGFDLMQNFAFPYFSRDIAEFWRRWHISLSTWFRDYLYIPLGGSRGTKNKTLINTFIIFLVSGFWHGANWTFIVWGFLHAIYFLPLLLADKNRKNINIIAEGRYFPSVKEFSKMLFTFILVVFAWIFFRAVDINEAIHYILLLFSSFLSPLSSRPRIVVLSMIVFLFIIEWIGREDKHALENFATSWKRVFRWSFYELLIVLIIFLAKEDESFIYFQF